MAHRVAHGGKIHDGWNVREILKQNSSGHEGNFFFAGAVGASGVPGSKSMNVVGMNEAIVFVAKKIFEKHFQRKRQARSLAGVGALERIEAVDFERFATDFQSGASREGVLWRWAHAVSKAPV